MFLNDIPKKKLDEFINNGVVITQIKKNNVN